MALNAIIRHGAFAALDFPADQGIVAMETTRANATGTKTVTLSAANKGGIHGITYTNPQLTFNASGVAMDVTDEFVLQHGSSMASFAGFTELAEFAAFTPAASLIIYEDPSIEGTPENTVKLSFNVFCCPTLPTAPA